MKFPKIDDSWGFNLFIFFLSLLIGVGGFIEGGGHLIEGILNPDEFMQSTETIVDMIFYLFLFAFSFLCFWVAIGAILGVYRKVRLKHN